MLSTRIRPADLVTLDTKLDPSLEQFADFTNIVHVHSSRDNLRVM